MTHITIDPSSPQPAEPTTRRRTSHWTPALTLTLALTLAVLASVLGACAAPSGQSSETGQATGDESGVTASQDVEQSSGRFDLALAGDQTAALQGTASCVLEESTETLRAALDPRGASDFLFYVTVPDYNEGSDDYDGTFEMSGGERATGPATVAVSREDDDTGFFERQLTLSFEGSYSGSAGDGTVKGTVHCGLPALGDSDEVTPP